WTSQASAVVPDSASRSAGLPTVPCDERCCWLRGRFIFSAQARGTACLGGANLIGRFEDRSLGAGQNGGCCDWNRGRLGVHHGRAFLELPSGRILPPHTKQRLVV